MAGLLRQDWVKMAATQLIGMVWWQYYGLIFIGILSPILSIFAYIQVRRTVPWAFVMYNAFKSNMPIIWKHGAKAHAEVEIPIIDPEIRDDKGIPVTYFRVPKWGLKFPDNAADQAELLHGKVKVIHYFRNYTRPVSTVEVRAMDDLKEWFKSKGLNITNFEDIIFTLLKDPDQSEQIIKELDDSNVDSEETKEVVKKALEILQANNNEVKNMMVRDGIFTYETAMNAIEKALAYTSSDLARTKVAIEANEAVKHQEDAKKDLYRTILVVAFAVFVVFLGAGIAAKIGLV